MCPPCTLPVFGILSCCHHCFSMPPKRAKGRRPVNCPARFREASPLPQQDEEERLVEKITDRILAHLGTPQQPHGTSDQPSMSTRPTDDGEKSRHPLPSSSSRPSKRKQPEDASDNDPDSYSEDDQVAKAVCGKLNHLVAGESPPPPPSPGSSTFHSVATPLGASLSPKLKSKIWGDEYVDFATLLVDKEPDYTITVSTSTGRPAVSMLPPTKGKAITDLNTWLNAFQIFAAVYTERHPTSSPSLWKYMAFIRDMATRGMACATYDINFRTLKQNQSWGFDHIHWEMYFNAQPSPRPRPQFPHNQGRNQAFRVPKGHCIAYHLDGKCTRQACGFKHFCLHCGDKHSSLACSNSKRNPRFGKGPTNIRKGSKAI